MSFGKDSPNYPPSKHSTQITDSLPSRHVARHPSLPPARRHSETYMSIRRRSLSLDSDLPRRRRSVSEGMSLEVKIFAEIFFSKKSRKNFPLNG
jgi:hypothetical protein